MVDRHSKFQFSCSINDKLFRLPNSNFIMTKVARYQADDKALQTFTNQ